MILTQEGYTFPVAETILPALGRRCFLVDFILYTATRKYFLIKEERGMILIIYSIA
jgi:hypothetical protein|tara:strand:+ start:1789 stop:1956 length:168 start_codon:yes stop_codon:yes gene_type:complete